MRALVADGRGGVEIRDVDEPRPERTEALVAVSAVSLNPFEVRSLGSAKENWRPGSDVSGLVMTPAADGSGPPEGAGVVALGRGGGWAERAAVPTEHMALMPEGLDPGRAATLPVAGLTALRALHAGCLMPDHRVLITGASGGVGRFAVQLAAHDGADVTAVVRKAERGADLERLGAARIAVGMPSGEFDVILESAGGTSLAAALGIVARRGTVVSFGNSSKEPTTFEAGSFFSKGGARLYAFSLFPELERLGTGAHDLAHLAAMAAGGHLDTSIDLDVSWHEAGDAIEALLARRVVGKAILRID
ncbi:MAG: zinc-binding dehydrogenase [Actinobacteria bacterium]|nr:zinc-binding dehydrogenase [Actinomycetota bacterium]